MYTTNSGNNISGSLGTSSVSSGTTYGGYYTPYNNPPTGVCPGCGRCHTCGRGGASFTNPNWSYTSGTTSGLQGQASNGFANYDSSKLQDMQAKLQAQANG